MSILQQYYDRTCTHLFKQGQRAIGRAEVCQYLTPNGLTCAVGCHIPQSEYHKGLEGQGIVTMQGLGIVPETLAKDIKASPYLLDLLIWLQHTHDAKTSWKSSHSMQCELLWIANKFGLNNRAAYGSFAWEVPIC